MTEETISIRARLTGTITVSTLDARPLDPDWERIDDLVYWSWCTRMQLERLACAALRSLPLNVEKRRLERQRSACRSAFEQHVFLLAAGNLDRALTRAGKRASGYTPSADTLRALALLRNVYEHWDNNRESFREEGQTEAKRAAKKLKEEFPSAEPWTLQFVPDESDVVVANLVSLGQFEKELRKVEAHARWKKRQLVRMGKHQPSESQASPARDPLKA